MRQYKNFMEASELLENSILRGDDELYDIFGGSLGIVHEKEGI